MHKKCIFFNYFTCIGILGLLTGWPVDWGLGIIWTDGVFGTTWFPGGAKLDPIKSATVKKINNKN